MCYGTLEAGALIQSQAPSSHFHVAHPKSAGRQKRPPRHALSLFQRTAREHLETALLQALDRGVGVDRSGKSARFFAAHEGKRVHVLDIDRGAIKGFENVGQARRDGPALRRPAPPVTFTTEPDCSSRSLARRQSETIHAQDAEALRYRPATARGYRYLPGPAGGTARRRGLACSPEKTESW